MVDLHILNISVLLDFSLCFLSLLQRRTATASQAAVIWSKVDNWINQSMCSFSGICYWLYSTTHKHIEKKLWLFEFPLYFSLQVKNILISYQILMNGSCGLNYRVKYVIFFLKEIFSMIFDWSVNYTEVSDIFKNGHWFCCRPMRYNKFLLNLVVSWL